MGSGPGQDQEFQCRRRRRRRRFLTALCSKSRFLKENKTLRAYTTLAQCLFFRKVLFWVSKKPKSPFLPRDYCGAFLSLILIHRRSLETLFVVTGLAQWAGTRIRSGSRIQRIPGSIPGTAGSDCLSYCWEIFEEFGTCLGDMSDEFRTCFGLFFGHVWECCGDLLRSFAVICGQHEILKVRKRLISGKCNICIPWFWRIRHGNNSRIARIEPKCHVI